MKVAILYSGSKTGGGIDTYLTNLFAMAPEGVELELLSLGEWKLTRKFQTANFNYRIFGGPWWNALNIFRVAAYLKKNHFDLIVSQAMVATFYARVASLLSGIPSLVTIHSDWRTDYRGAKKVIYLLFDRLFRFRTKRYIAVSEYLKERLVAENIKPEEVEVVRNGVASHPIGNPSRSQGGSADPKIKIRNNPSFVIGSIGRLHSVKNFEQLILAVKKLKEEGKLVKLEIAGEGKERKRLEKIIRENNLEKEVRLLGWQKDLDKLFLKWDIYIQPSLAEGFGLSVVEAMLAGLPVIVSPGGALPELVNDGETGFVATGFGAAELGEVLEKTIESNKLKEIAQNGKRAAERSFSIERWVAETVQTYKGTVK